MNTELEISKHFVATAVVLLGVLCATAYYTLSATSTEVGVPGTERRGVVVVTGGNSGIGFQTARLLALEHNFSKIVLACRNEKKGLDAARKIKSETTSRGGSDVIALRMDLASVRSVENFVDELERRDLLSEITTLINNGGVNTFGKDLKTTDDLEYTFGINYFGHFVLTTSILSRREKRNDRGKLRVVNLSSVMHWTGRTDFDILAKTYRKDSYASSKLAMNLFALELEKRYPRRCVAFAVNPGAVQSNIYRDMDSFVGHLLVRMLWLRTETGALASVRAATMSDADVERDFGTTSSTRKETKRRCAKYLTPYFVPGSAPEWVRRLFDIGGPFFAGVRSARPSAISGDHAASGDLWRVSEALLRDIRARKGAGS